MIDVENGVQLKRNKGRLEEIRKEEEANGGRIDSLGSGRYAPSGAGSNLEIESGAARSGNGNESGAGRDAQGSRSGEGAGAGIRSTLTEDVYPASSNGQNHTGLEASVIASPAAERWTADRAEKAAELHRQRQQRYADRKKAEETGKIDASMLETSASGQGVSSHTRFTWKLPGRKTDASAPSEKVKLFTAKEVSEEQERLTEIYQRGSGLIDDLLEVIVKDHEPVSIWQLSNEEAETLAEMHLERAKVDEGAARSARKLLEIYDRLYIYLLIGPKLKATGSHIKDHKGLSFR